MARFLGIFTGSMMIFTLLVKLLVFSYLIRNYGLRTCLAISPILVAVFTVIAITIGMLLGYTPESISGFLIFFLLLALSRLFSKAFKDSIESPSFKVIYQTIDEKVRYEVQSGMDGTVNEIAALILRTSSCRTWCSQLYKTDSLFLGFVVYNSLVDLFCFQILY